MNYLYKKMAVVAIITLPSLGFAQEDEAYPTATITTEFCVQLNPDVAISEMYEIDISHLHLPTPKEADDKFGHINNNLLTYTVDFGASKAYLQIHLDRTPESHDIVWWNTYLNSLCGL